MHFHLRIPVNFITVFFARSNNKLSIKYRQSRCCSLQFFAVWCQSIRTLFHLINGWRTSLWIPARATTVRSMRRLSSVNNSGLYNGLLSSVVFIAGGSIWKGSSLVRILFLLRPPMLSYLEEKKELVPLLGRIVLFQVTVAVRFSLVCHCCWW